MALKASRERTYAAGVVGLGQRRIKKGDLVKPLGEEAERGKRCGAGAVLIWNNRKTEMADPQEIETLFFALVRGSTGTEIVFLNQNLAIRSAPVLRDFHAYFLGTFPVRFLDLIYEP